MRLAAESQWSGIVFDLKLPDQPLLDPTQRQLLKLGLVLGPESIARSVPVTDVSSFERIGKRSCIPVVFRPFDDFGEVVGIGYGTVGLNSYPTSIRVFDDDGHYSVCDQKLRAQL